MWWKWFTGLFIETHIPDILPEGQVCTHDYGLDPCKSPALYEIRGSYFCQSCADNCFLLK